MNTHGQLSMLVTVLYLSSKVQSGTHLDKPWFRWSGGRVPYFFQVNIRLITDLSFTISKVMQPFFKPRLALQMMTERCSDMS